MVEQLKGFVNTFNFDMLMNWLNHVSVAELLLNPFVLGPIVVIIGLMSYSKTAYLGQQIVVYLPAILYLSLTMVILRNDVISNTGPFIMAMGAFFLIIGWFVWTRLLGD
ncbi:MAG: hypothetical protein HQK86_14690 [Nitrospinae bacterium]|nr:hypothetical protein [Nitrospinota bacterium]